MGIINISIGDVGQEGENPRRNKIVTTDALAVVVAAGYLDNRVLPRPIASTDIFDIIYSYSVVSGVGTYDQFTVTISAAGVITLVPDVASGNVVLPVVSGHFANFSGTTGLIADLGYLPSNAAKTVVSMVGSAVVANHMAIFQDVTGTIDDTAGVAINNGAIQSGLAAGGVVGNFVGYPTTTSSGFLAVTPVVNGTGNFNTTISNASAVAQSQVVSIPDSGAATANFLLSTGAANILAQQQFVGIKNVLTFGTGTWTVTRIAQGNYVSRHTAGDETSIIAVDITPIIRVAASKGFRLDSFDYIYSIGTLAMDAHSLTLDQIVYANNVAVSVVSVPVTATLATATQANPYVTNCTVTTPAFDITADSKYVIEITANNSATSAYDFYGVMLRFSQTIG